MKPSPYIVYILTALTLSSCATLLNSDTTPVTIATNKPAHFVVNHDTLPYLATEQRIWVQRSRDSLLVHVYADSLENSAMVKAKNSFAYWLNLYPGIFWTGFLIDKNNPKRYTYPKRIFIDLEGIPGKFTLDHYPRQKGGFDLHLSLPHINSFLLKPDNEKEKKVNTGFWGITLGLDYYIKKNQFLNLSLSGVCDFFVPFPAAVDISGEYEMMSSAYLSITCNHRIRSFTAGYGLCFAENTWDLRFYDRFDPPPPEREPVKKSTNAIGFVFPLYYQAGESFFFGIVYRPTIFRFSAVNPITYEHLISIDLGLKLRLKEGERD